jgi:hypothetical protein
MPPLVGVLPLWLLSRAPRKFAPLRRATSRAGDISGERIASASAAAMTQWAVKRGSSLRIFCK